MQKTELRELINLARDRAKRSNSEHVLPEHLAFELLLIPEVRKSVKKFGTKDLKVLLSNLDKLIALLQATTKIKKPSFSFEFEYIIKQAVAISLLSGKKNTNHLDIFISLLRDKDSAIVKFLGEQGLDVQAFTENFYGSPAVLTRVSEKSKKSSPQKDEPKGKTQQSFKGSNLRQYTEDYIELASQGKFHPLLGRQTELDKIIHTLSRQTKNSVLLVGDSGVGKTAIIEGLATKISKGDADLPDSVKDLKIQSLDINNLVAGSKHHGSFEERIKGILDEIKNEPNAVLFIDDIHNIFGNGGSGSMDLAAILKNYMSRDKLRIVGCLTDEDFKRSFDKDRTLLRRFYKIEVDEPTPAESIDILMGMKDNFKKHYGVIVEDAAIVSAVTMTTKYLHDKRLPDKAIDLLDSAAARTLPLSEDGLRRVTVKEVLHELSSFIKVSDMILDEDDKTKLKNLKERLETKIFGQDAAIQKLMRVIYVSKSGLRASDKTVANLLFQGPTASGKTELAKELSKNLGVELVRIDLSAYQEKLSLSSLIGSPPGYVGYGDGKAGEGLLISSIEKNPNCVLLLDEVEKAHPDVLNILLQVMDYGVLTSASGKTVNCRNVILIMTSNIGAEATEKPRIGFGDSDNSDKFDDTFKKFFRPEFRSRLDSVIMFKKLGYPELEKIVTKNINEINQLLAKQEITLTLDQTALAYFTRKAFENNSGARIVASLIDDEIKPKLAHELIYAESTKTNYVVEYKENKIVIK